MNTTPHNNRTEFSAKQESPRMFDRIAARYDLLNRLLSMRRDVAWRRRLVDAFPDDPDLSVLDVATGTADVLLTALQRRKNIALAVGLDPAAEMLRIGNRKIAENGKAAHFIIGDARSLPFPDASFDVTTIAFGIRNVPDVGRGLSEMHRILRRGGHALILEFSLPRNALLRQAYLFYFRHVLPRVGAVVSGDSAAYQYLNRTVEDFPRGPAFCKLMQEAGFLEVADQPLTFGIASIYTGMKK